MHFRNTLLKENNTIFSENRIYSCRGSLQPSRPTPSRTDTLNRHSPVFSGRKGKETQCGKPELKSYLLHLLSRQTLSEPRSPNCRGTVLNILRGLEEPLEYIRGSAS